MSDEIQLRRGTSAEWASANPILADGEFGWDKTVKNFKVGDGTTHWDDLDFADLGGGVDSVNGQTGTVDLDASLIPFTPSGGLSSTDVESAIIEASTTGLGPYQTTLKIHGAVGGGTVDDSAAWMSMITAVEAAGSGTLLVDDDTYLFNQALVTSRNGNAILPLPNVPFRILGVRPANNCDPRTSTGYSIFKTTKTGLTRDVTHGVPSLLGGPTDDAHWLEQMVSVENICFWLPHNPTMSGVDLHYVRRMNWDGSVVYAISVGDADFVQPTSVYTFGLRTPDSQNFNCVQIRNGASAGTYAGLVGSVESLTVEYWSSKWHVVGWAPMTGGHAAAVTKLSTEACNHHISGWSETAGATSLVNSHIGDTKAQISVTEWAIEDADTSITTPWYATVKHVNDSTNRIYGVVFFDRLVPNVGPSSTLTLNGASNLTCIPLLAPNFGGTPPTRQIATDSTLTGGGDLSADRTLGIDTAAEAERIRDVIGSALVAGSGASITVNDAGDTITIGLSGGGAGTLTVQDENSNVATAVTQIDFQGAGVTASSGSGEVVVTIPGGSGVGSASASGSNAGDLTNTSTTFADMSGMTLTIPASVGQKLLCTFTASVFSSVSGDLADTVINIGGTDRSPIMGAGSIGTTVANPQSVQVLYTVQAGDISGGNVTVKVRWRTNAHSAFCLNSSGRFPYLTALNLG